MPHVYMRYGCLFSLLYGDRYSTQVTGILTPVKVIRTTAFLMFTKQMGGRVKHMILQPDHTQFPIYPCPAELFQFYFSSFEAGIANAISSFK